MDLIKVKSESDSTLVINIPTMPLHKIWNKRGQIQVIDREQLEIAYYNLSVETLFKEGSLSTDDELFLKHVGLMTEDGHKEVIILDSGLLARMTKLMPLKELGETLNKLSGPQLEEVCNYVIENYKTMDMARIEMLEKATGKKLLRMINNLKISEEE